MAKYFTYQELTRSRIAEERGLDNTPTLQAKLALSALANSLLDPIREMWGSPISVNSGFRSPVLNKVVGGSINSQHVKGEAADITTGSQEDNRRLFRLIAESSLKFDQLIDEKNYTWIHLSYRSGNNRQNILHLLYFVAICWVDSRSVYDGKKLSYNSFSRDNG